MMTGFYVFDPPMSGAFMCLHGRINQITGAFVKLAPAVEVHPEDLDWLERLWAESDRLDFEIWRAGAS